MVRWRSTKTEIIEIVLERGYSAPLISAEAVTVPIIEILLNRSYGMFGHQLSDRPTAHDLNYAIMNGELKMYEFKLIEGAEEIQTPAPIPKDALS